ncbi:MAG TPA: hypothetical protein VIC85_14335 [Ktedonobacterales bacterium]
MRPEDRLDALLSAPQPPGWALRSGASRAGESATMAGATPSSPRGSTPRVAADDPELAPLMDAAQRLAPLAAARPDPVFAQALEVRVLAHSAERRTRLAGVPEPEDVWGAPADPRRPRARASHAPLRVALVAAAVLVALGLGAVASFSAAAQAVPGSPLFGLHRLEQNWQVVTATDSAGRARLHLEYAHEWLAVVRDAATSHLGDPTYRDAVQAVRDEDTATAREIAAMGAGTERTALAADLANLRADERTTLRAALPAVGWPDRVLTTTALGQLGISVPSVASATLASHGQSWRVTLTGTGFAPGAVLLVDGQPAGQIISVLGDQLEADVPATADSGVPGSLGIGNPDYTAAATSGIRVTGSLEPVPTATTGDHDATPTVGGEPTATPGDDHGATPTATDGGGEPTPSGSPTQ